MRKYILSLFIMMAGMFAMAQNAEPTETEALLKVTVTNFKEVPRKDEPITFESLKTKKQYSGVTNEKGKFSVLVPKGDVYAIKYNNNKENVEYNKLKVDTTSDLVTIDVKIKIEPPRTFILDNVLFDTGKASLKSSSYKSLNELVELLKIKRTMVIEIDGHTDNMGSAERNLQLSKERANTVRNYLIRKGIKAQRVSAKGYGETKPISSNDTEEGRKLNRRTEVNIISE
jgi:OmpA-OmpF porin, OOP family